jgi:hypothetical protein
MSVFKPTYSTLTLLAAIFLWGLSPALGQVWQGKGRIAISSDGNEHDHDDWAATPFSLALLAASGLQDKLVLYTFSDHVWGSNHDHSDARAQMRTSALEGADTFGFTNTVFLEAVANPENAYNALKEQINASTANDPLFIIAAGPMQVVGEALDRSTVSKRQFVTVISHSNWNDNHSDNPSSWESHSGWKWSEMVSTFSGDGVTFDHITDQNGGTGYDGMRAATSKFNWLKTSTYRTHSAYKSGSWDWLYSRQETCIKNGEFDPSDAGMIIYFLTGKEKTDPSDAKAIMENPVTTASSSSITPSSSSSTANSSSSIAQTPACDKFYTEIESVPARGEWAKETSLSGYNGSGYFYWHGGNVMSSAPTASALSYTINLSKNDTYKIAFRGRRDLTGECAGAASDECNDIYVKVDNGPWNKTMVKGTWGEWIWQANYEPSGSGVIPAEYNLSAGTHTIQVTGRSEGVKLDAFSVYPKSQSMVKAPVAGCSAEGSSSSEPPASSSSTTGSNPANIDDLAGSVLANGAVKLVWSDVNGEDGYRVRRRIANSGGTYENLTDLAQNAAQYTDATTVAGTSYEYMVRPIVSGVAVALSNTVIVEVPSACTNCTTIIKAVDFTSISQSGAVPYYIDNTRDALAINAANTSNQDKWAKASVTFDGADGIYTLTLSTLTETDGESPYAVYVNGKLVGNYTNPVSATDYQVKTKSFADVELKTGDVITVQSKAVTNGTIPEGSGTAYSRGRWRQIELEKTGELPISSSSSESSSGSSSSGQPQSSSSSAGSSESSSNNSSSSQETGNSSSSQATTAIALNKDFTGNYHPIIDVQENHLVINTPIAGITIIRIFSAKGVLNTNWQGHLSSGHNEIPMQKKMEGVNYIHMSQGANYWVEGVSAK